jgi:hypothetical protein
MGLWLALLQGCGWGSVDCTDPDAVLAEADGQALRCEAAVDAVDYIELLAGRPLLTGDRPGVLREVGSRFEAAPAETVAWLEQLRKAGVALAGRTGLEAAEQRSAEVWKAARGDGPITSGHGAVWKAQKRALGVWSTDDEERLAVTEADLEAWIRYASLCREAQGATVLRISVADRVTVYKELIARFDEGDRQAQIALASMGPVWREVRERWQAASYERQQEWIAEAPLPPPMTATSLGYAEEIFRGDVWHHASALHEALGPFPVGSVERFLAPGEAPPPPPPPPDVPADVPEADVPEADVPEADVPEGEDG